MLYFSYFGVGSGLAAGLLSSFPALGAEKVEIVSFLTGSGFLLIVSSALAAKKPMVPSAGLPKKPSLARAVGFLAGAYDGRTAGLDYVFVDPPTREEEGVPKNEAALASCFFACAYGAFYSFFG